MKRSSSFTPEENFIVQVLLKKDLHVLIHSFCSDHKSFFYTGILCKEMVSSVPRHDRVTDIVHTVSNTTMLGEYLENVHTLGITSRLAKRLMRHAAVKGDSTCIREIHEIYELVNRKKFDWGTSPIYQGQLFDYVAGRGDVETMMFLQSIGCRKGHHTLDNSIMSGNRSAFFWTWFNGCSRRTAYTFDIAEKVGIQEIIDFLYNEKIRDPQKEFQHRIDQIAGKYSKRRRIRNNK